MMKFEAIMARYEDKIEECETFLKNSNDFPFLAAEVRAIMRSLVADLEDIRWGRKRLDPQSSG